MLHKVTQIDTGHWEIDGYTLKKEWVEGEFSGAFYFGLNTDSEQVTDAHTTFESCLGELIWYIEDRFIVEEKEQ